MNDQWVSRSRVKWQIQTKNGLQIGLYEGITALGALDNMAKSKGHDNFMELCRSLGIEANYKDFDNFRIIWL